MPTQKVYSALGFMSGTSLDGVDCALIETDGHAHVVPKAFVTIPYTEDQKAIIRLCFGQKDHQAPGVLVAQDLITDAHIMAARVLMERTDITANDIDLIGFHGQTIFHEPANGITIQIGDGARMAQTLGIDVVDDFRSADVAAGGEGAPLAPLYHAARIRGAGVKMPCALLNIGGVANVTWVGAGADDILAFDTGPGNALMDDWAKMRIGAPYDAGGALAAQGCADKERVQSWMAHEYFKRQPPKSLDRGEWDITALGSLTKAMDAIRAEDGAATLLDFTVEGIAAAQAHFPQSPETWYACGGGRHNAALMAALRSRLNGDVRSVDDLGWNGDATEAECFAYLAVRSVLGLPISFPTTTRAPKPMTGGAFHRGHS